MPSFVIDYFELPTADMGRSSSFFRDAFGWGNKAYGPGYGEILDAGVLGGLNADPADRPKAPLIGIPTDDMEAAASAFVAAGGVITVPAYGYPGGRRLFFREPGGAELL